MLNCDGFLLILSLSIFLMWSVDRVFLSRISRKYVASANLWSIMLQSDSRTIEKRETAWTLDLASVQKIQALGKLGVTRSRQTFGKKQVLGGSVIGKPGVMFVPPSVVEQSVKLKSHLDLKIFLKTVSLEQVKTLVREFEQEDVCDMEVDVAEVRWQESDIEM